MKLNERGIKAARRAELERRFLNNCYKLGFDSLEEMLETYAEDPDNWDCAEAKELIAIYNEG